MKITVEVGVNPQGGGVGWPEIRQFVPTIETNVKIEPEELKLTREQYTSIVEPVHQLVKQMWLESTDQVDSTRKLERGR
jgi:hypothetical protein